MRSQFVQLQTSRSIARLDVHICCQAVERGSSELVEALVAQALWVFQFTLCGAYGFASLCMDASELQCVERAPAALQTASLASWQI